MKSETIINLIIGLLITVGLVVFVNAKTDNSMASLVDSFNACDINILENCSLDEKEELLKDVIVEINKRGIKKYLILKQ